MEEVPGLYIRRLTLEDPRNAVREKDHRDSRSPSPARHICHRRSAQDRPGRGSSRYFNLLLVFLYYTVHASTSTILLFFGSTFSKHFSVYYCFFQFHFCLKTLSTIILNNVMHFYFVKVENLCFFQLNVAFVLSSRRHLTRSLQRT